MSKSLPVPNRILKSSTIKGVESKLASLILDEIVDGGAGVSFDDIAGLQVLQPIKCLFVFKF